MNETVLDKFLRYAKIDTQSKEDADTFPSTSEQLVLLNLLLSELHHLGLHDAEIDQYGYVMATLKGNLSATNKIPTIGLLAHVDTSPATSGTNVKPQVIENYQGNDIVLKGDPSVILYTSENPELKKNIGKTIVTTDGTTLLGADDKAGVAIIMTAIQTLINTPSIPHGNIRICFTPDEEVGNGTKYLDLKRFNASIAYTVDGSTPGELNKETFSADTAIITIKGRNIHPGTAKGLMVNSLRILGDIIVRLPIDIAPETTDEYQPFIHPHVVEGNEEKSTLKLLLRDFKTEGLDDLKRRLDKIIAEVQQLHPKASIELQIIESYRNMHDGVMQNPLVSQCLWEAAKRSGIEPKWVPIRGGTDGSRLTAMGLPTPNIFTGGQNYHSKTEWVSVHGMEKSVETVINLMQVWAEKVS